MRTISRQELGLVLRSALRAQHGSIHSAARELGKHHHVLRRAWAKEPARKRMKLETIIAMLSGAGYRVRFVVEPA